MDLPDTLSDTLSWNIATLAGKWRFYVKHTRTCSLVQAGFPIAAQKGWKGFSSGKLTILKMLLEKGARTDLRDKYGKTAVDWAKESRNQDALKLLENK